MAKRWIPPRWAKLMKREKDEGCEEATRQIQIMYYRRKQKKCAIQQIKSKESKNCEQNINLKRPS